MAKKRSGKNTEISGAETKIALKANKRETNSEAKHLAEELTPAWLVPTALTLLILGMVWLVVYYVTSAMYPLPIGNWNMLVAFSLILLGGLLFTRWK